MYAKCRATASHPEENLHMTPAMLPRSLHSVWLIGCAFSCAGPSIRGAQESAGVLDDARAMPLSDTIPESRAHHQLAYHAHSRRVHLIGGSTGRAGVYQYFDDHWMWSGHAWTTAEPLPFVRSSHRVAYHDTRKSFILFGGGSGRTFAADSAVWELQSGAWRRVATSVVGGRAEAALCYDRKRDRLVMFGGWDSATRVSSALWEWTGDEVIAIDAPGPSARAGHALVYDPRRERCLLFGGRGDSGWLADTWEWDGVRWRQIAESGPSARWFFGATTDHARARIVIFGGNGPDGDLGDTWVWDGQRWQVVAREGPLPRGMGKLAFDGEGVLLFGGRSLMQRGVRDLNDTWRLVGTSWRRVR